jgi:hypothetical protein
MATDRARAVSVEAPSVAPRALPVLRAADQILALQRTAGNQAVGRMLAREPEAPAAAESVELGGMTITTNAEGAAAIKYWCLELEAESKALDQGRIPAPVSVETTRAAGLKHAATLAASAEPLDAELVRTWYADFVKATNAARSAQAAEAAERARRSADELAAAADQMAALEPQLRDVQRERFRNGNEKGLLEAADAIANVLDTALAAKETIDQLTIYRDELQLIVGQGTKGGQFPLDLTGKVRHTVDVLERINKVYARFQLVRAGIDLLTAGKTANEKGQKGITAMGTLVSAGGTLLNASAGFSLYGNLYIGPMTEAIAELLTRLDDLKSKGSNRQYIQAGRPEMVDWSVEPGGRPMFDFMMVLMQASSAADVPEPPKAVDAYFVDNEDEFSAGVGKRGGALPTEGALFWEETDKAKIKTWCFRNRKHLWGMLYGAAEIPNGPAF